MGGYALSEVEEAPSYSADEVEEAPTTQQSSAAIDQATRPQSPAPVAPSSARMSLGTAPRPVAAGLVTEQQERRDGMPLQIQPASGSLANPHPEQVAPVPRPTTSLAGPATPNVKPVPFQEPGAAVGLGATPGTPPQRDLPDLLDALQRGGTSVGREVGEDVMGSYERLRHPGISVMQSPGGPYLAPTRPLVGPESDVALADKEHPYLTGAARVVGGKLARF
jgi:hypothetical protein